MMEEQQFWLLVSLKFSGEATPEELAELESAMKVFPERRSRMDILYQLWQQKNQDVPSIKEDHFDKHMQRLSNHLSRPVLQYETNDLSAPVVKTTFRYIRWGAGIAAAVLTVLITIYVLSHTNTRADNIARSMISTKPGSKSKIQLPDGSQVWLNADSRITYNENFAGDAREVHLTGEAFFDVVKDKDHPFIIHTTAVDIKVLGTSFNVRSYADEKSTETSLVKGSVEVVLRNCQGRKIILKPDEKLIVKNDPLPAVAHGTAKVAEEELPVMTLSKMRIHLADSSATETQWIRNRLAFDAETLKDVARMIERWYDVRIKITDDRLKQNTYSGVFEDESLPQVIRALQLTGNFKYSIDKKEIIITP